MKPPTSLSSSHQRTFEKIFQHPISHNLEWREVRSLLRDLGQIEDESNGNLKISRNGQTLIMHPTSTKDISEMDEIMALRHFLERSDTKMAASDEKETHWLLVIDHHEARIFRSELVGAVPQTILPHEPAEYFRHGHNSKEVSRGQEKPDPTSFFEPVAKVLQAVGPILIFGTGTGTSSEMEQFNAWVKIHRPELAKRIIGSLVVDEHHLTEGQLLARARDFYKAAPVAEPAPA
jgi:hypothetical protein